MKNKIFKFLSLLLAIVLYLGVVFPAFAADEIPDGYTPIYTAEDLNNIRNNLSGNYILMNDIDLSVYEKWVPIGTEETPFTGTFDGDNYSISNLKIHDTLNNNNKYLVGLFGNVSNGTLKNIVIANVDINVSWNGETEASYRLKTSALAANSAKSKIIDCSASGNISLSGFEWCSVGGIAGYSTTSSIANCSNYAEIIVKLVSSSRTAYVGGVAGYLLGNIDECCNFGSIGTTGTASSRFFAVGGVLGKSDSPDFLKNLYNIGKVYTECDHGYIGGIAGECSIITDSYNAGEVVTPELFNGCAGGIAGNLWTGAIGMPGLDCAFLRNCCFIDTAEIPAYLENVSYNELSSVDKQNSFKNVNRVTNEELKQKDIFEGFDFENVWTMEEGGYPVLQNQPMLYGKENIELKTEEKHAANINFYWISSDENVATVDENGNITAVGAGTATITAIPAYNYYIEYKVTVTEPTSNPDPEPNSPLLWLVNLIKKIWNFVIGTAKMLFA